MGEDLESTSSADCRFDSSSRLIKYSDPYLVSWNVSGNQGNFSVLVGIVNGLAGGLLSQVPTLALPEFSWAKVTISLQSSSPLYALHAAYTAI